MGAKIPNIEAIIGVGMNPKTGLPYKMGDPLNGGIKEEIKKVLRIADEQDAVNRYTWYNLPGNISSQELERMLYYKGQLCFFYDEMLDEFYFMPYALDGGIDFYGRYSTVHPIPMYQGGSENEKKEIGYQQAYLSTLKLKVQYGMMLNEPTDYELKTACVLLHDYTKQLSQTIIPRQILNEPIIDAEADCIPYMKTALMLGTGIKGMRVNDADQKAEVKAASKEIRSAALNNEAYVAMTGNMEFQELSDGPVYKGEEYMMAMQSIDNFRLSLYGLDNGGLFEKKAHMLESENDVNQTNVGLVLQDGISIRQNFCNIVNSIWGLGIWCEPSQTQTGDTDGDGLEYDENEDGENSGGFVDE